MVTCGKEGGAMQYYVLISGGGERNGAYGPYKEKTVEQSLLKHGWRMVQRRVWVSPTGAVKAQIYNVRPPNDLPRC
ncbi:MAG: hypothetical protein V1489_00635 [Candidatus Liptonbacteria bacterium]